jgi:hypothetical protein
MKKIDFENEVLDLEEIKRFEREANINWPIKS